MCVTTRALVVAAGDPSVRKIDEFGKRWVVGCSEHPNIRLEDLWTSLCEDTRRNEYQIAAVGDVI